MKLFDLYWKNEDQVVDIFTNPLKLDSFFEVEEVTWSLNFGGCNLRESCVEMLKIFSLRESIKILL